MLKCLIYKKEIRFPYLHNMIYDCFNFLNEFELLDIRLNELDKIVDKFVLVESTVTFTNKPKPLYFSENKNKYKKFLPKITHVIVKDSPNVIGNPWIIENFQLSAVVRGLKKCHPNDTILISCADEIPRSKKVVEWKDYPGRHKVFLQDMYYYYLNNLNFNSPKWKGTQMFSYKNLMSYSNAYVARFSPIDVVIPDGGWHFTFMGGVEQIRKKLFSYSHQEYNNPKYNTKEKILKAVMKGEDLFNQGHKFKKVKTTCLPQYVQDNINIYKDKILQEKHSKDFSEDIYSILLDISNTGRSFGRLLKSILRNDNSL